MTFPATHNPNLNTTRKLKPRNYTNICGTWAFFDRHVNNSQKNTDKTIDIARSHFGSRFVKVDYKDPFTNRYCLPAIGCYVELSILTV